MPYPKVSVVISTMFEKPEQLRAIADDVLNAERKAPVELLFVVQVSTEASKQACQRFFSESMPSDNIRFACFYEKGLARSRNRGIHLAMGDVVLFGDTDCRYPKKALQRVQDAYNRLPETVFITFQAENRLSGEPMKTYWKHEKKHNMFSIMRVGSWELSFRRNEAIEKEILFDERFGLVSRWPSGAENVFMSEFLKKGLLGLYVPEKVVLTVPSNDRKMNCLIMESKGALLRRVWGISGAVFAVPFLIRRHRDGFLQESFLRSALCLFQGWWRFPDTS